MNEYCFEHSRSHVTTHELPGVDADSDEEDEELVKEFPSSFIRSCIRIAPPPSFGCLTARFVRGAMPERFSVFSSNPSSYALSTTEPVPESVGEGNVASVERS
jgi:hypothetical protein